MKLQAICPIVVSATVEHLHIPQSGNQKFHSMIPALAEEMKVKFLVFLMDQMVQLRKS